jgi:hypothetical protein
MATLVPELSSHILAIVVLLYNSTVSDERRYEYNFSDFEECEDVAAATDYRGTLLDPGGRVTVEIKAGCIKDGIRVSKGEPLPGTVSAEVFEPGAGLDVGFAWEGFSVAATFSTSGGGGGGSFSFGGFPSTASGSASSGSGRGVGASFFAQAPSPLTPPSPPTPVPLGRAPVELVLLIAFLLWRAKTA